MVICMYWKLASIPNKCMQCCLFLKKPALKSVFCVGFPSALSHAQKITSAVYVIFSLRCSQLMKIMQNENGFFFFFLVIRGCHRTARPVPSSAVNQSRNCKWRRPALSVARTRVCVWGEVGEENVHKCCAWWEKCCKAGCRQLQLLELC